MKRYSFKNGMRAAITGVLASAAVLTSCVSEKDPYNPNGGDQGRMGTVSIGSLNREGDFVVVEFTKAAAAAAALPDVESFRVAILDSKGENVVQNSITGEKYQWPTFAEVNGQMLTIHSGKYKLEAANLETEPLAAWDTPYYYGLKDFTVKISELTKVDLICKLANVKATVEYDPEFIEKVDNPSVEVYTDFTDPTIATMVFAPLTFEVGETRAGYFKVPTIASERKLYVKVTGKRKADGKPIGNGDDGSQLKIISKINPMEWHKIKIRYQETGQISPSVVIDHTTVDSDHTIEIPDGDGVIDGGPNNDNWEDEGGDTPGGDALAIVGANFNDAPFDISEQLNVSVANANVIDVRLDAPKGIDQLYVSIESEALRSMLPMLGLGYGVPFDIANPPADSERPEGVDAGMWWVNMFAGEGIGILDPAVPIKGKTSHTFSVGGLMSLLASLPGSTSEKNTHKFNLRLVDADGKEKKATLAIHLTE